MNRRSMLAKSTLGLSVLGLLLTPRQLFAASVASTKLQLVKEPGCECCAQHARYLRDHGYIVEVSESDKLTEMRAELGVPDELAGCHVILAQGYVIEGHVPAAALEKLLVERPAIKGISVPGMPAGSPGMDGEKTEPLVVFVIDDGLPRVFLTD